MLVSVVACNTTDPNPADTTEAEATDAVSETEAETTTEAAVPTGKVDAPAYTGVFKTGYDRQDVTPSGEIKMKDGTVLKSILDRVYVTCIAVNDGENTVLLFTMDAGNVAAGPANTIKARVSKATKVPEDNIIISGTHTHSAPQLGFPAGSSANMKWDQVVYAAFQKAAQNAIADLSDSEVYTGATLAENMSFVRRWFYEDGTPGGIWRQPVSGKKIASYENDSDDLFQYVRFVRADKKDILLANWGIHFTNAGNTAISSDLNFYFRTNIEKLDDDVNFAFYIGPSGNVSFKDYVGGMAKYNSYAKMGTELAKQVVKDMSKLTRVEPGKISVEVIDYDAKVLKDDATRVANATKAAAEIAALKLYDGDAKVYAVCAKYGFESAKEVNSVVSRNKDSRGEYDEIKIVALSFGDIGITGVPYEMFDTNGIEIREASPFKTTIVITGCGGSAGYVPSALAVPNGGYEVYTTPWEFGTAEIIVNLLVESLRSQVK